MKKRNQKRKKIKKKQKKTEVKISYFNKISKINPFYKNIMEEFGI